MQGSKRNDWEFVYGVKEVADAAFTKASYHLERGDHWQRERDAAEAELREKGIDFRTHEVTGGKRVQMVIDPERQSHLDRCEAKISDHQRRFDEYNGFACSLAKQSEREPDANLELTVADILYFGLA